MGAPPTPPPYVSKCETLFRRNKEDLWCFETVQISETLKSQLKSGDTLGPRALARQQQYQRYQQQQQQLEKTNNICDNLNESKFKIYVKLKSAHSSWTWCITTKVTTLKSAKKEKTSLRKNKLQKERKPAQKRKRR